MRSGGRLGVPRGPVWTVAERLYLIEHGATEKSASIAMTLGRTKSAVRAKASDMGVRMRYPKKYNGMIRSNRDLPATRTPSVRDLEWAAGFLEGEGHFRRSRVEAKQISTPEPLERLRSIFGGKVETFSMQYQRARGGKANDGSIWSVAGSRAAGVMMTLFGLLSKRRQGQIRVALNVAI